MREMADTYEDLERELVRDKAKEVLGPEFDRQDLMFNEIDILKEMKHENEGNMWSRYNVFHDMAKILGRVGCAVLTDEREIVASSDEMEDLLKDLESLDQSDADADEIEDLRMSVVDFDHNKIDGKVECH